MRGFFFEQAANPFVQNERRGLLILSFLGLIIISIVTLTVILGQAAPVAAVSVMPNEQLTPREFVDILVPVQDVRPGTRIEPQMLKVVTFPAAAVSREIIRSFSDIKGHYAATMMVANQPIHSKYLSLEKQALVGAIRDEIQRGYVAVTIRVNEVSANAGLIRPGDYVNVGWTGRKNGELVSTILMQNIKVLVSDRDIDPNWKPGMPVPTTITLLVTLEDYKILQVGQVSGTLSLALKGMELDSDPKFSLPVFEKEVGVKDKEAPVVHSCRDTLKICKDQGQCDKYCVGADGQLSRSIEVAR